MTSGRYPDPVRCIGQQTVTVRHGNSSRQSAQSKQVVALTLTLVGPAVLLMCELSASLYRQAMGAGRATSSLCAAQSGLNSSFGELKQFPTHACGPAQPCYSSLRQFFLAVTLRLAHHQQDVDLSNVLPLLMFLRVQHSIKSGQFLSLDRGTIDLTENAFEGGKVWPCTFCFRLAFMLTRMCGHRQRRTSWCSPGGQLCHYRYFCHALDIPKCETFTNTLFLEFSVILPLKCK